MNEIKDSMKEEEEEEGTDEPKFKSTSIFPDHNTIRWRWVTDSNGKPVKQSNTRVVCWSDGSKSLQVGSELFDMVFIHDHQNQNPLQPPSKSGSQLTSDSGSITQGLTYLFVRQGESQVLESQTSITGQISLRPYSLNSLTHRNLVANRSMNKTYSQRQTQSVVVTVDPEMEKLEKEIEESKQFKKNKKEESKRNRTQSQSNDQESLGKSRIHRFNAPVLSREADEEIEEEEEEYEEDKAQRKEFTELELADQRLEQSSKKKRTEREDELRVEEVEEKRSRKKLLIIASDDED
ncbi:Leo1-like protein-domain-containing protein [Melampsora americana]|nr:Leo1-like protein-domain-containing protein [Melampsora americana]